MLRRLLHWLVARPAIYNLVQTLAGQKQIHRRLQEVVQRLPAPAEVLDLGGGTGLYRGLFAGARYICLDLEAAKLRQLRGSNPNAVVVQADATAVPLADGSVDLVLCTFLTHHLDERQLPLLVGQIHRILRPGGQVVFVDAVWQPSRWAGRLLWRYDRGSFPRPGRLLAEALGSCLRIEHQESFSIFHEYLLAVARKVV
jgi:ubiquinone/menaquinone biosynthesis C-methylase UbiE